MNSSTDDLTLAKLNLKVDRTATGVYTSQERSRDLKIESYSLNYHGRVLIDNATIELNFGRRYGLIGANGSGKSTFLQSLASKDIEIPSHFDVSVTVMPFGSVSLTMRSRTYPSFLFLFLAS